MTAAPPPAGRTGDGTLSPMRVRWLRLVPGVALLAVAVWVWATRWSVLWAAHPAYPLTLLVAGLLGGWLVVSALTARQPARGGWWRWTLRGFGALAGVLAALTLAWLRPFAADPVALAALAGSPTVRVVEDRTAIRFEPVEPTGAGLVLYPGARVDPRAYSALALELAEQGHPVVVLACPFDIAFLCAGRAGTEAEADPGREWVVGGHSLGGVVAGQDVADATSPLDGLLLWASYPLADLSGRTDLPVASVSGTEDGLTTPADIADSVELLPPATTFVAIAGAVHAFFGDYGEQPGDGTPTITRADAQRQIVDATVALLDRVGAP